jgi:hypothetical protein
LPTLVFVAAALIHGAAAAAAEPADAATPARVFTRSGEVVLGVPEVKEIEIETKYGLLKVPIADVLRLEIAQKLDPGARGRIDGHIDRLRRAEDDDQREAARDALIQAGPLAIEVLQAAKSNSESDAAINEALTDVIESILEEAGPPGPPADTLVTRRFTAAGEIRLGRLALHCAFGNLAFAKEDIIRVVTDASGQKEISDAILVVKTWTDPEQEFRNVRECLSRLTRMKIIEVECDSAAALKRALSRSRVLVLPEFENGSDAIDGIAGQSAALLRRFVQEGGVVICCGGDWNYRFLNASKLLSVSGTSSNVQAQIQGRHPILRGVSGAIPYANATFPIQVNGSKMKTLAGVPGGGIVVGVAAIGEGAVVYCGWDFYESQDSHQRVIANAALWGAGRLDGR